jgi:hypothetical protein
MPPAFATKLEEVLAAQAQQFKVGRQGPTPWDSLKIKGAADMPKPGHPEVLGW